jgi:hypothetical protein
VKKKVPAVLLIVIGLVAVSCLVMGALAFGALTLANATVDPVPTKVVERAGFDGALTGRWERDELSLSLTAQSGVSVKRVGAERTSSALPASEPRRSQVSAGAAAASDQRGESTWALLEKNETTRQQEATGSRTCVLSQV